MLRARGVVGWVARNVRGSCRVTARSDSCVQPCRGHGPGNIRWTNRRATHDNVPQFMAREPRDDQLTIRIPLRIRATLEAQAARERRTVADVVNNLLEEHYPRSRGGSRRQHP